MDRHDVFVEYGRVLEETANWLEKGYSRPSQLQEVIPPALSLPPAPASSSPPASPRAPDSFSPPAPPPGPLRDRPAQLLEIAREIRECRLCDLYLTRKETVPGLGRVDAPLMVITSPPLTESGEGDSPLSPQEVEYLSRWLSALGLHPLEDVFITGIVKCRTPGNRPPRPQEAAACQGFLQRQVQAVAPRALLILGSAACQALTGSAGSFHSLAGKLWNWQQIPALVLWSPGEVLVNPERLRRPVWEALKKLKVHWDGLS